MRTLLFILFTILTLSSCEKEVAEVDNGQYLIFGDIGSVWCPAPCSSVYKITNTQLFEDELLDFHTIERYKFSENPLSDDKYKMATTLLSDLPSELVESQDDRLIFPPITDTPIIYLEYFDGNKTSIWRLIINEDYIPTYLSEYLAEVEEIVKKLDE